MRSHKEPIDGHAPRADARRSRPRGPRLGDRFSRPDRRADRTEGPRTASRRADRSAKPRSSGRRSARSVDRTARLRRTVRLVGAAAVIGAILVGLASVPLFIAPATAENPAPADAVVMYGGGGNRLDLALELVRSGASDTLVVSNPLRPEYRYPPLGRFCRNPHDDFTLVCFDPEPKTTRGESRYIAELAEENGWDRLIIVTSTDQVTRAQMMVNRCWDGDFDMMSVPHEQPIPYRVIYEWGALGRALTTRRTC